MSPYVAITDKRHRLAGGFSEISVTSPSRL
jgi:hypothetical protein